MNNGGVGCREKLKERFLKFLPDRREGECWEWQGERSNSNYGLFSLKRKAKKAHRMAILLLTEQEIPKNMVVMHLCHNKPCCNPEHLRVGTRGENHKMDYDIGVRSAKGESNGCAKLKNHEVVAIRALREMGLTYAKIASVFPVTWATIQLICVGKLWKDSSHLDKPS